MKLSQLIQFLEDAFEKYGDIDAKLCGGGGDPADVYGIAEDEHGEDVIICDKETLEAFTQ